MPKLNVQQNNANVIKALRNALAIGRIKGPIACDGADNFSSGGGSNPNLLDNWYWGKGGVVNQRGFTTGVTSSGLTIDRWRSDNLSIALSDNGITIPANSTFKQILGADRYDVLIGKVVTLSCLLSNGTIQSGSFLLTDATGTTYAPNTNRLGLNGANKQFHIYPSAQQTIKAVKLELGPVSTLANDLPNYAEELAKCQSLFFRLKLEGNKCFGIGFAESTTSVRLMIPVPSPMRTSPTITVSGTPRLKGNGQVLAPSAYATNNVTNFNASVCVTVTTTGATQYAIYALSTNDSSTYIDFSADL